MPLSPHRPSSVARALAPALVALAVSTGAFAQVARVDTSTITGKVLVGYQGWFRCPNDGSPSNNWSHYTIGNATPAPTTISVANYPITDEWQGPGRCKAGALTVRGQQAFLFSSFPQETADIHFRWMREYGIDGALLQRFTTEIGNHRNEGEAITLHAMKAAEDNGRSFAIEYDLSRTNYYDVVPDDQVVAEITGDWQHLVNDLHITDSPSYQKQDGKPLVSLWGLGFNDDKHPKRAALAERIIRWFKDEAHAEVMGGVPGDWRQGAAGRDPAWASVLKELDIVQPWTVGAYGDRAGEDSWKANRLIPDIAQTQADGQIYMPVILPGSASRDSVTNNVKNDAPRQGGDFFWHEVYNTRTAGATVVKIAMFDEMNEGTSLLKLAPDATQAPDQGSWLNLDADGFRLPSDWYLRLAYEAGRVYRGESTIVDTVPTDPGPFDPAPTCGVLGSDRILSPNQPLFSCNGAIHLSQDADGDLTAWRGNTRLYSSGTKGLPIGTTIMQGDGNLVEYDTSGEPRWSSGTAGHDGAYLYLRNDGATWIIQNGNPIWTWTATP